LLIYVVILGLVFWLLWWGLGRIGLPEPFNKVATVILVLAAVITCLYILMGIAPPLPKLR
jgi:hypothetical protein